MGSPDFAVPALEALHASEHEIVAVVSGPDKKRGRGGALSPTPVKAAALRLGLPTLGIGHSEFGIGHFALGNESAASDANSRRKAIWQPLFQAFGSEGRNASPNPQYEMPNAQCPMINAPSPDLFVVVAFKILPAEVLAIPRLGAVNIHASLLPKYRGAAPIHHAVMAGETETGCTIFKLDAGVDTGGILMQERASIGPDETSGEVYERLSKLGAQMIVPAVDLLESGSYELQKQDDMLATKAPKLRPEHQWIDLGLDSLRVHNHIRGMSPFPGAWLYLDGQRFRIYRTRNAASLDVPQGKIVQMREGVFLGCAQGAVELVEVQIEGRKATDAASFFAGYRGECEVKAPG